MRGAARALARALRRPPALIAHVSLTHAHVSRRQDDALPRLLWLCFVPFFPFSPLVGSLMLPGTLCLRQVYKRVIQPPLLPSAFALTLNTSPFCSLPSLFTCCFTLKKVSLLELLVRCVVGIALGIWGNCTSLQWRPIYVSNPRPCDFTDFSFSQR